MSKIGSVTERLGDECSVSMGSGNERTRSGSRRLREFLSARDVEDALEDSGKFVHELCLVKALECLLNASVGTLSWATLRRLVLHSRGSSEVEELESGRGGSSKLILRGREVSLS